MKALAVACYASALTAIVYVGVTGIRWPLSFASAMIVGGIVTTLIDRATRHHDDDR